MTSPTYLDIDNPYDNNLNRAGVAAGIISATATDIGSVEQVAVRSEGSVFPSTIDTELRSTSWKPKTQGFRIDGQTGNAEFNQVFTKKLTADDIAFTIPGFSSDYSVRMPRIFSGSVVGGAVTNTTGIWAVTLTPGSHYTVYHGFKTSQYAVSITPVGAFNTTAMVTNKTSSSFEVHFYDVVLAVVSTPSFDMIITAVY